MKIYNAKLAKHSDRRFSEIPIALKCNVAVHASMKLSWIEPLDENASSTEKEWYMFVVNHNVVKE